jgi:altronate dehydratase
VNQLKMYRNADGTLGVRCHVLILPLSAFCASAARLVGEMVAGTTVLVHPHGRNEIGFNRERLDGTLQGAVLNPNVHSAVVIGYEGPTTEAFVQALAKVTKKKVEALVLLDEGGTWAVAAKAARKAAELVAEASECERVLADWKELRVGAKCGGSDGSSVLASNPVVGQCSDWLVERGATVIFSETTEIIGAEHLLAKRARTPEVAAQIIKAADDNLEAARRAGVDLIGTNPVPDNIAGGISTIEEKALGGILKAGTYPIEGVLSCGEPPSGKGLYFMDSSSGAHEVMSAFAAAGCQLVIFTTGSCNPVGNLLMPVIKVCGNREAMTKMADHQDVDVSAVIEEGATFAQGAQRVMDKLAKVAGGALTSSEICRHIEFPVVPTGL